MTPLESEVRTHRGCPTLFVNGRPCTGLTFFWGRVADGDREIREFARQGIDGYSGCIGVSGGVQPDGSVDFAPIDERYRYILAANPRVLILPRVAVDRYILEGWWREQFGSEAQEHVPLDGSPRRQGHLSFASEPYRRAMGAALRAYIRHCEERYGDRIFGYHIGGGAAGEWSYAWESVLSDYGPAQQAAFRAWLRRRYANDLAALRAAWRREDAAFETAAIPAPERRVRQPGQPSLFDPLRDRDALDYLRFHSEVAAEAVVHFCSEAKAALRELGRRKIVGAFYGYHFKNLNRPSHFHNTGHFANEIVLQAPDVDFICAPYCYQAREDGHLYTPQLLAGSVRLHGKLSYCEDDTFTHRATRVHGRARCADQAATIGVLRRNLIGVLREGGALWWMDCGGNGPAHPQRPEPPWYREPELMANFGAMQRLAAERLEHGDYTPSAQVAVFFSDLSTSYQRLDSALMDALIMRQMFELGALGAPFDVYLVSDLELLFRQSWAANYRMLLFADCLHLSAAEREAVRTRARTRSRTLVWTYGAGVVDEDGFSVEKMYETTGLRVALRERSEELIVSTFRTGARVLYGTERQIGPVIFGADPDAEVTGWFLNTGDPGLLEKRTPEGRTIWSGAPAMPAALLRQYAREAGVHLYVETGEQVLSDGALLAVHAGFSGERTVRLPRACDVVDAYTQRTVARGVTEFRAALQRAETGTWELR